MSTGAIAEIKHTPGPWVRDERTVYKLYSPNGKSERNKFYLQVTPDYSAGNEVQPGEMEANAKLIAAAPDLLEALQRALPYIKEAYIGAFPDEEKNADTLNMALAAINKATL